MCTISREDFLGVGTGYDPLCTQGASSGGDGYDVNALSAHGAFTFDAFTKSDGAVSNDRDSSTFDDLRRFVESAGRLVLSILQEERSSSSTAVEGEGSSGRNRAFLDAVPFGTGPIPLGSNGDGKLNGMPVRNVLFSPFAPLLMMTCHDGDGKGGIAKEVRFVHRTVETSNFGLFFYNGLLSSAWLVVGESSTSPPLEDLKTRDVEIK